MQPRHAPAISNSDSQERPGSALVHMDSIAKKLSYVPIGTLAVIRYTGDSDTTIYQINWDQVDVQIIELFK